MAGLQKPQRQKALRTLTNVVPAKAGTHST